ncbi:MAG: NAD(P)/FAD-dependent oxidoreductase [Ruminococcaceae bacterium]|nr:NAD(P)/FAD-dependent oxidoreductase [Oscillospiraceae bacterium]
MKKIAVIGGGAAGLIAAGTAHELGASVTLFEKNAKLGRKVAITGKGRCNVTNNCSETEFMSNVVTNPRFLYSALSVFSPADTMEFFESRKVKLKTERGNRVFPVSDRAYDIVDALGAYASKCKIIHEAVTSLVIEDGEIKGVCVAGSKRYDFDAVIVCTGGASYPLTGSTGDGYRFAKEAGHTVTPLRPALIPIDTDDGYELAGLSLKNVVLNVSLNGKKVFSDIGEMLFTHSGISGPLVLSASSLMSKAKVSEYTMSIDLKPALDKNALDKRILSDFEKYKQKNFGNALSDLLPIKMIPLVIGMSGISEYKKVYDISREERLKIVDLLKAFPLTPLAFRHLDEAIVTSGGVSVKEINPKTMESKLVRGLYFAGEVLDVDAFTGGFNLQIAFSTGRCAALSAIEDF